MGKRNVFYDEDDREISVYLLPGNFLHIEIKDINGEVSSIDLPKIDAVLFILDLYRMKRKMVDEKSG